MAPDKVGDVPNQPREGRSMRAVRLDDQLWQAVRDRAEEDGVTATDVVAAALVEYVKPKTATTGRRTER